MRWGLGPVFIYECLANSRRWQTYALRSIGVVLMLVAISSIATSRTTFAGASSWREYAALGESFFYAIIGVELTLVMLAAPAATAGAICVDRARGTLTHMLATDLSDPEIVLGKLAARILPILGLMACTWPVLAICSLLGGIDPMALTLAFAIILAVALLGCTMALALSVWARKPHEVVLVVYTFWMLVMLLWPIWYVLAHGGLVGAPEPWSLVADPFYLAYAPYSVPGRLELRDYLGFFAATLGASAVLAVLAVWRMRPVARRGTDDRPKAPGLGPIGRLARRLPGPSLDGNPVFWREWYRSRPSRWLLILVVLLGGSTSIAGIVAAFTVWTQGLGSGPATPVLLMGIFGSILQLIFGLLVISAVAPMSMSEERQRGSLDLLASTTLSTRTIVLGKWLGTFRLVPLLAIVPGLMGFALATASKAPRKLPPGLPPRYFAELSRGEVLFGAVLLIPTVLVHGALIASVGLALAAWIKRQGRAIALSVGFTVLVGFGWPILMMTLRRGGLGEKIACLSPVIAAIGLVEILTSRLLQEREDLWWITYWDVECLLLALGLLWLTVRTFDGCFDRLSDRPRRTPALADVVLVLAGLAGFDGLFAAIAYWTDRTQRFLTNVDTWITIGILLVAVGLILLSALAPLSIARVGTSRANALEPAAIPDRKTFAIRWWQSFRMVLLLAIGPALIALAQATAPLPTGVARKVTTLPSGDSVVLETDLFGETTVTTYHASGLQTVKPATADEIASARLYPATRTRPERLAIATLPAGTILAHGAAIVSLGLALGIWIKRRGQAIAASVSLLVLLTAGWPILCLAFDGPAAWGWTLASVLPALFTALFNLPRAGEFADMAWWIGWWDAILILAAVIITGLAIFTLDRKPRVHPSREEGVPEAAMAGS